MAEHRISDDAGQPRAFSRRAMLVAGGVATGSAVLSETPSPLENCIAARRRVTRGNFNHHQFATRQRMHGEFVPIALAACQTPQTRRAKNHVRVACSPDRH